MKQNSMKALMKSPRSQFRSERDCRRCGHVKSSPESNSRWYCERHNTHVRPGKDECGYFIDSGQE